MPRAEPHLPGRLIQVGGAAGVVAVVVAALVGGCSGGDGSALREGGSALSSTASTVSPAQVEDAALSVERAIGSSGDLRRCVRIRMSTHPRLTAQAAALDGSAEALPVNLARVVDDCESAAVLVPSFLSGFEDLSGSERSCLVDVFLELSGADRALVTSAAVGVSGGQAASDLGARVSECRSGGGD